MALTSEQRRELWVKFMSEVSRDRVSMLALAKDDLRDAVNAIDNWIDDRLVDFNNSIPQPAKNALTQKQKVRLFGAILRKRWEVE